PGELLVTDLLNEAFPLIRYELGDRSRLLPSVDPGASPPLLDYVHGRMSDIVHLINGQEIPGELWTTIFDDFVEEVCAFTVHQSKSHASTVTIEPGKQFSEEVRRAIHNSLSRICGETPFCVQLKSKISHNNGKLHFVTSEVRKSRKVKAE